MGGWGRCGGGELFKEAKLGEYDNSFKVRRWERVNIYFLIDVYFLF